MPRTALRELVEIALREDVCVWVARRRTANPKLGARKLAAELQVLTGRSVSHMSLRRWCPDLPLERPESH